MPYDDSDDEDLQDSLDRDDEDTDTPSGPMQSSGSIAPMTGKTPVTDDDLYQHIIRSKFDPNSPEYQKRVQDEIDRSATAKDESDALKQKAKAAGWANAIGNSSADFTGGHIVPGTKVGSEDDVRNYEKDAQGILDKDRTQKLKTQEDQDKAMYEFLKEDRTNQFRSKLLDYKNKQLATKGSDGKPLPAKMQDQLSYLDAAQKALNSVDEVYAGMKPDEGYLASIGRQVKGYVPGSKVKEYNENRDAMVNTISLALSRGNSLNPGVKAMVEHMLPKGETDPRDAASQIASLRKQLNLMSGAKAKSLKGYNAELPEQYDQPSLTEDYVKNQKNGGDASAVADDTPEKKSSDYKIGETKTMPDGSTRRKIQGGWELVK